MLLWEILQKYSCFTKKKTVLWIVLSSHVIISRRQFPKAHAETIQIFRFGTPGEKENECFGEVFTLERETEWRLGKVVGKGWKMQDMLGDERTGRAASLHLKGERQPPDRTAPPTNRLTLENSDFIETAAACLPSMFFSLKRLCHGAVFVQSLHRVYSVHRGRCSQDGHHQRSGLLLTTA